MASGRSAALHLRASLTNSSRSCGVSSPSHRAGEAVSPTGRVAPGTRTGEFSAGEQTVAEPRPRWPTACVPTARQLHPRPQPRSSPGPGTGPEAPRAVGMSPQGARTAPSSLPAQLGRRAIWGASASEKEGRVGTACPRSFPREYPSNRVRAGGRGIPQGPLPRPLEPSGPSAGERHGGRVEKASCPHSGHRETVEQGLGGEGATAPRNQGATVSAGSWAWACAQLAPGVWFLPCPVHGPAFLLGDGLSLLLPHGAHSARRAPRVIRAGSCSVPGQLVPACGVLSPFPVLR